MTWVCKLKPKTSTLSSLVVCATLVQHTPLWPCGKVSTPDRSRSGFDPCFPQGAFSLGLSTASLARWLRRPPRELKIPGSNPACDGIFPGSSHTSDLKKMALQWLP